MSGSRGLRSSGRLGGVILATAVLIACGSLDSAPALAQTFVSTSAEQTFIVPPGVASVAVDAVGGHGGSAGVIAGGAPARVSAVLPVTPGEVLYVEVAGNGESAAEGGDGGFNGGGASGEEDAAGGGGASDVRTLPRASGLSPDSRLLAAGGGGGAAEGAGGDAGSDGAIGNAPEEGGGAGTLTSGGAGATGGCGDGTDGQLGRGGDGGTSNVKPNSGAGGGGGGYYGGGGGGAGCMSGGGGGGGGSSFVTSTASNISIGIDPTAAPAIEITPIVPLGRVPSNRFSFGRLRLNRKKGTATLPVRLPDAGVLLLNGRGVFRRELGTPGASRVSSVAGPGPVMLRIRARGKWLRRLRTTGRVKVKAAVTFTPTGGTPNTKRKRIVLKKAR